MSGPIRRTCSKCGKQRMVGKQIKPAGRVCAFCQRERQRVNALRQYHAHKEKRRKAMREWKRKHPEKQLEYERAHYHRVRQDPKRYAKYREQARMTYRLRREKQGNPLKPLTPEQYQERYGQLEPRTSYLPAEPIRTLLDRRINGDDEALGNFARRSGVDERRLRSLRSDQPKISLHNADRIATAFDVPLSTLYPELE